MLQEKAQLKHFSNFNISNDAVIVTVTVLLRCIQTSEGKNVFISLDSLMVFNVKQ